MKNLLLEYYFTYFKLEAERNSITISTSVLVIYYNLTIESVKLDDKTKKMF